jgi:O-antigen/teichoic acid export membrane protein
MKAAVNDPEGVRAAPSRTVRARNSSLAGIVRTGIVAILGIVVTPYVQRKLGKSDYGSWLMLTQLLGYLLLIDIFPISLLKYDLANQKKSAGNSEKNKFVRFAVASSLLSIPMFLLGGVFIWFYAGDLIGLGSQGYSVKAAVCLMVLVAVCDKLATIPEFSLIGENLEYKSISVRTGLAVCNGTSDVVFVAARFGFFGLAMSRTVGSLLNLITMTSIARRQIPWLSFRLTDLVGFWAYWRRGTWLILQQAGNTLIDAVDIFVVGAMLGPATAAVYSLTSALTRLAINLGNVGFNSLLPGYGELCGAGDAVLVANVRREAELLLTMFWAAFGTAVMAGNRAFVPLWVGPDRFGGNAMTALVLITGLFLMMGTFRMGMMLFSLQIVRVSILRVVSGLIGLVMALVLGKMFGVLGYLVGFMIGRIAFAFFAGRSLNQDPISQPVIWRQYAAALLSVFGIGMMLNQLNPHGWVQLIAVVSVGFVLAIVCFWFCGANRAERQSIQRRFSTLVSGRIRSLLF